MQATQLRREMRALRRQLSTQTLLQHSLRLQRLASRLNSFRHSRRIAFYIASRGEIDPWPLLMQAFKAGKQVYLPVLRTRPSHGLWFAPYRPGDPLTSNRYGIPEPIASARHVVMPWAIDLVCVPLLAFDATGSRLGMGGGYYDRTFAFKNLRSHLKGPKLIGLAHEFQRVDELHREAWDIPLDAVVTECSVYRFMQQIAR